MKSFFSRIMLTVVLVGSTAAAAVAEDAGITVTGTGTVKGRPTVVQIDGTVSGEAELAADANVKFRDSKKKAVAAVDNLKNPDLTLEFEGSGIHEATDPQQQMRMQQGQATDAGKPKVSVSEHIKLTLKNVDQIPPDKVLETVLKLLDSSRDAGLQIGSSATLTMWQMQQGQQSNDSLVTFKIPDTTQMQAEAYKLAVTDARARAEQLAKLAGCTLGAVTSVQDDSTPTVNGTEIPVTKEATSGAMADIPVTAKIVVHFQLVH